MIFSCTFVYTRVEFVPAPVAPQMFGNAGLEHCEKYGTTHEQIAKIAEKNHRHSVNNPYSQFKDVYTLDEILSAKQVYGPLTKLQCCPTSEGGAAAVLASEAFVKRHGLEHQAVEIDMAMATDMPSTFNEESCIKMVCIECVFFFYCYYYGVVFLFIYLFLFFD